MSKDIKKALEHCVEWNCGNCPNRDELGSGEIVCRGRLLPEVLEYVSDLEAKLADSEKQIKGAREAANMAVDSWCKNRRKYEAHIAELQQQLKSQPAEIVEEIKQTVKNNLVYPDNRIDCPFNDGYLDEETLCSIMDKVLQEYQKGEN